jgi:hypothetical protein
VAAVPAMIRTSRFIEYSLLVLLTWYLITLRDWALWILNADPPGQPAAA